MVNSDSEGIASRWETASCGVHFERFIAAKVSCFAYKSMAFEKRQRCACLDIILALTSSSLSRDSLLLESKGDFISLIIPQYFRTCLPQWFRFTLSANVGWRRWFLLGSRASKNAHQASTGRQHPLRSVCTHEPSRKTRVVEFCFHSLA